MTIAEHYARGKQMLAGVPKDVLMVGVVVLASSGSFGLGMLADREMAKNAGIWVENLPETQTLGAAVVEAAGKPSSSKTVPKAATQAQVSTSTASIPVGGQVVASKTGTKYFLPWCGSVKRIKEENKVWFTSAADAKAHGYAPAANCKGL
jgi:hypothetical protein